MLSQPVHRYEAKESGILDGALFVFAQGVNPEVLLLIEAQSIGVESNWWYGFAPMTSYSAKVHQGDKLIWSVERQSQIPSKDQSGSYFFRNVE